jgi:replicative DNA helicase
MTAASMRFSQALTPMPWTWPPRPISRDGGLSGVATGLRDLDFKMGGLQRVRPDHLAGRPAMGKTALATNIAFNVARAMARRSAGGRLDEIRIDGGIVGFFSLEMSAEQLATRILSERTGISSSSIRRGGITEADFAKLARHSIEMQTCRSMSTTPAAFRSRSSPRARGG